MFLVPDPNEFIIADSVVRTTVALTAPQLASLKTEYQTDPVARGYAGKTQLEVWKLLVRDYQIANPVTPQPIVPRTDVIKRDEFVKILNQKQAGTPVFMLLRAVTGAVTDPTFRAAQQILWLADCAESVDFNNGNEGKLLKDLKDAGVITNNTYKSLTDVPDPTWTPFLNKPRRVDVVLGTVGGMLTMEEVAQVMAP